MKCYFCGKGIESGVSLIPIEPKGTKERKWACVECVPPTNVPDDVKEICSVFDESFK